MTMTGRIKETIGDDCIQVMLYSMLPIIRKNFITFGISSVGFHAYNELLDSSTFNKDKYNSFIINKDGYAEFDVEFEYKMKLNFRVACPLGHYAYTSRFIKISDKSPDISKGYPIISEELSCRDYRIVSKIQDKETIIFNADPEVEPFVIPYTDVKSFPTDDPDKFVKKVQNILLLG